MAGRTTKKIKKKPAPKKSASTKKENASKSSVKKNGKDLSGKNKRLKELTTNIYPIGKHKEPEEFNDAVITKLIQDIRVLPDHLKNVSKKINKKKKLQYTYRDGGWNIEQLIHHIADSHLNAYTRFKLALTENNPTIKPYDENLWAETADMQLPIKVSIKLLKAIHAKWTILLENMDSNDWKRTYYHPEHKRTFTLSEILPLYAWHGKHHVAQIEVALKNG